MLQEFRPKTAKYQVGHQSQSERRSILQESLTKHRKIQWTLATAAAWPPLLQTIALCEMKQRPLPPPYIYASTGPTTSSSSTLVMHWGEIVFPHPFQHRHKCTASLLLCHSNMVDFFSRFPGREPLSLYQGISSALTTIFGGSR